MSQPVLSDSHVGPVCLLDLDEAAAYLGVTPRWLRHQWFERRIAAYKLNRLVRFSTVDLDAFAAAGRVDAVR